MKRATGPRPALEVISDLAAGLSRPIQDDEGERGVLFSRRVDLDTWAVNRPDPPGGFLVRTTLLAAGHVRFQLG